MPDESVITRWLWRLASVALLLVTVELAGVTLAAADSFTFYGWAMPCGVGDQVVEWPGDLVEHIQTWQWATVGIVGAQSQHGIPAEFIITGTEIVHRTTDPNSYAVIGMLDVVGTGGDYISRMFWGPGSAYLPLNPEAVFRKGDQINVHAQCSGVDSHSVFAVIYFRPIP